MKIKLFFSAAIMAIAMTGCTSDEVVMTPETAEIPISFEAVTNNMTRAANSFNSSEQPNKFYVTAFMFNEYNSKYNFYFDPTSDSDNDAYSTAYDIVYKKKGDTDPDEDSYYKWTSKITRTWPKYDKLNFFAFFDSEGTKNNSSDQWHNSDVYKFKAKNDRTVKIENYLVENSNTPDLMYAVKNDVSAPSDGSGKVTLNFVHALSQICFKAENLDEGTEYYITSIVIEDINKQGTFDFGSTDTSKGTGGGSWTVDYEYNSKDSYMNYTALSESTGLKLPKKSGSTNGTLNISDLSNVGSNDDYPTLKGRALNLIPQTLYHYDINNYVFDPKITVKFKPNNGYEKTAEVSLAGTEWLHGKRYIYNLQFKPGDEIAYGLTIDDYTTDNDNKKDIEPNLVETE